MNFLNFFTQDTANIYGVDGELKATEKVHLTRQGISNNDFAHTHKYKALLEQKTVIDEGDLLDVNGEKYLTMAMRKIQWQTTNQANLYKCDYECGIYRLSNTYIDGKKADKFLKPIKKCVPCVQKDVNGKMNYYDAGLLETTIKIVYIQYIPELKLMDRLIIDNHRYKIESINKSNKGILILQLSDDKQGVLE